MPRRSLPGCGVLSSLVYVVADILGASSWEGYGYASQSISELSAIGAPSRSLVLPLALAYDALLLAFGLGVCASTGRARALRVTGASLIAVAVFGLIASLWFPMHLRGGEQNLSDGMHIALTAMTVSCIVLAMASAANTAGRRFRVYTLVTLLLVMGFGALAALDGPRVAEDLPTPMLGINERISVGAYLLWVIVLALALPRPGHERARKPQPRARD